MSRSSSTSSTADSTLPDTRDGSLFHVAFYFFTFNLRTAYRMPVELPEPPTTPPTYVKIASTHHHLFSQVLQVTTTSSPHHVLLRITGVNTHFWSITNLITNNVSTLTFHDQYSCTAHFPHNRNPAPFRLNLAGTYGSSLYQFHSTWKPQLSSWTGEGHRRILIVDDTHLARYDDGGILSGRRSGSVEIGGEAIVEGGWGAFDEIVVTGIAVAELVKRR